MSFIKIGNYCHCVMPLVEFMKYHHPADDSKIVNFTARLINYRVLFYFNTEYKEGEALKWTFPGKGLQTERLLLEYGEVVKNNKYDYIEVEVITKMTHINLGKISICHSMRCAEQDIKKKWDDKPNNFIALWYKLNTTGLNLKLLSWLKMGVTPNEQFDDDYLYSFFITYSRLSYVTESLAVASYYQILKKYDHVVPSVRLNDVRDI